MFQAGKPITVPLAERTLDGDFDEDFDTDPDPFNDDIIAPTCDTENPDICESCT